MQVNIKTEQSFHFSAEDIAELIAAYLRETHKVNVLPENVIFDIRMGYSDPREFQAPGLNGATVRVVAAHKSSAHGAGS